jgi:hypothetical protein
VPREIGYQYSGKTSLRDVPELVTDNIPLPVRRHGTNYRVIPIWRRETGDPLPRYVIDLQPLDEFPADSSD